jgi:hypothetical protein
MSPVNDDADMPQRPGASTRRWLAKGGFQGHQIFWAGPLRRKRSHRRLDLLAEEAKREPSPIAATKHVRVIKVPETLDGVVPNADVEKDHEASPVVLEVRPGGGFHVRPVPIEQPFMDWSADPDE